MFAYCNNNPVNCADAKGTLPGWLLIAGITAVCVAINHIVNAHNERKIKKEIKQTYTRKEAKKEIEDMLSSTKGNQTVDFQEDNVEIADSNYVTSRYDRQKASMIIARTEGLSAREYDNISAEWLVHNVLYDVLSFGPIANNGFFDLSGFAASAHDVNIDYGRDERLIVVFATNLFELVGLE